MDYFLSIHPEVRHDQMAMNFLCDYNLLIQYLTDVVNLFLCVQGIHMERFYFEKWKNIGNI